MDKEKLKLIVRNLKSLVNALESEVHSNPDAYKSRENDPRHFYQGRDDDDGYAD